MAQWAVVIPAERYEAERLYHHETLTVDGPVAGPAPGDDVLVVTGDDQPVAVAAGRVRQTGPELVVAYRRREFDAPVPVNGLALAAPLTAIGAEDYHRVVERFGGDRDRRTWLVSLDLPIEAETPAEAVRQFWSYVMELGPRELPAFVSPSGDELAMQAFVLGAEANLDPEEDDDE